MNRFLCIKVILIAKRFQILFLLMLRYIRVSMLTIFMIVATTIIPVITGVRELLIRFPLTTGKVHVK